jgi:hypothetical protein
MALDASSSLGAAIGIQGTPTDKSMQFAQLGARQDAAAAKQKAAGADKDAKEVERLAKMFKVDFDGYLPKRAEEIKLKAAEFTKLMQDSKASGNQIDSDPKIIDAYNNLRVELQKAKQERIDWSNDVNKYKKDPNSFAFDPEKMKYGSLDAPDNADYYVEGMGLINKIDYVPKAQKLATEVGQVDVTRDVGGLQKRVKEYNAEETKKRADQWINGALDAELPDLTAQKFLDEKIKEFYLKPENTIGNEVERAAKQDEAIQYAKNEAYKYFKSFQSKIDAENRDRPNVTNVTVNTGGAQAGGKAVGTSAKSFDLGFQTNAPGYAETSKVTSLDGTVFEGADLSVLIPSNAVSVDSGQRLTGNKGNKKVTGGEMQIINVFKQGTKAKDGTDLSGTAVPDEYLDLQLKAGVVEPKLMFFGQIDNGKDAPTTGFFAPAESMIKNYDVLTASGKIGKQEIKDQYDRLEKIVAAKRGEYEAKAPKRNAAQPTGGTQPKTKQLVKTLKSGTKVYSDDNGKTWHP